MERQKGDKLGREKTGRMKAESEGGKILEEISDLRKELSGIIKKWEKEYEPIPLIVSLIADRMMDTCQKVIKWMEDRTGVLLGPSDMNEARTRFKRLVEEDWSKLSFRKRTEISQATAEVQRIIDAGFLNFLHAVEIQVGLPSPRKDLSVRWKGKKSNSEIKIFLKGLEKDLNKGKA